MAPPRVYLAVDLGAGSGRVMAGLFDGALLRLEEVHRFPSRSDVLAGACCWDLPFLWGEIKEGLRRGVSRFGPAIASVGVDSWAVDYAYLDRAGNLLGLPRQYRDPRTAGMMDEAARRVGADALRLETGNAGMFYNTAFQVLSEVVAGDPRLAVADRLLMIPDLIHWLLTGIRANEWTNASTTQMFNQAQGTWAGPLLARLGLPTRVLGEVLRPGAWLGETTPDVSAELGATLRVAVVGTHDTASAVLAVPAPDDRYAYLSSGTWSLLGTLTPRPVLSPAAFAAGFTNEAGVGGDNRLLKILCGMWLVQESQRTWAARGESVGFDEITRLAAAAPAFTAFIQPDDPAFAPAGDMPARVAESCRRSGQPVPPDRGTLLRVIFESLALRYRQTLEQLDALAGRRHERLHIVGGGAHNRLLNQMTADALGREVLAGPAEATACGNILAQMMADRALGSAAEGRALMRASFPPVLHTPAPSRDWDDAYARFLALS